MLSQPGEPDITCENLEKHPKVFQLSQDVKKELGVSYVSSLINYYTNYQSNDFKKDCLALSILSTALDLCPTIVLNS